MKLFNVGSPAICEVAQNLVEANASTRAYEELGAPHELLSAKRWIERDPQMTSNEEGELP